MSDAPGASPYSVPRKRRWYQFGLRSLFLLTTVVIGLLVAWRSYVEPYRQQREAMEVIQRLGGTFEASEARNWQRWLIGNDFQNITLVNLADCDQVQEFFPHIARLPLLETLVVGGPNVTDEHLRRLRLPSLRMLVLDSTWETEEGVARFQRGFPQATVYHSERRAIAALASAGFMVSSENAKHTQLENSLGPQFNVKATAIRFGGRMGPPAGGMPALPGTITSLPGPPGTGAGAAAGPQDIDPALTSLGGCRNLWVVDLRGTSASDKALENLPPLNRHLRWLYLTGTSVTDAGLEHLQCLGQLEGLYLGQTKVTDRGLEHLSHLTNLRWLNLSSTQVGDAGLVHLSSLSELKMLWVPMTSVSPDGIARLQKTLPNCTIIGP